VYALQVLMALFYANFVNSVERLYSPVHSAPPCSGGFGQGCHEHVLFQSVGKNSLTQFLQFAIGRAPGL